MKPLGFEIDRVEDHVNRGSFGFQHELNRDSLFCLESLRQLIKRRLNSPEATYWSTGSVDVSDGWSGGTSNRPALLDAFDSLATSHSLIVLKNIERDAAFASTIKRVVDSLVAVAGRLFADDIEESRGTLLIASPHRVTSYHIDADASFLYQVASDKRMSVWNRLDRGLLTDEQLERFFAGDISAAVYQPERQGDAAEYMLNAGDGVHLPSLAPHWAQNLEGVSVALSVNFDLRSVRRLRTLYRFNHRLRKMGISPDHPSMEGCWSDFKVGGPLSPRRASSEVWYRESIPRDLGTNRVKNADVGGAYGMPSSVGC